MNQLTLWIAERRLADLCDIYGDFLNADDRERFDAGVRVQLALVIRASRRS